MTMVQNKERGSILLVALAVTALLALAAATLLRLQDRSLDRLEEKQLWNAAYRRCLSGLNGALYQILTRKPHPAGLRLLAQPQDPLHAGGDLFLDGRPFAPVWVQPGEGPLRVRIQEMAGRAGFWGLDEDGFLALAAARGLERSRARALFACLHDWSDPDHLPRLYGAEAEVYRARHLPLPPNRPPVDLEEWRGVWGMDDRAWGILKDWVDADPANRALHPNLASEDLLVALYGPRAHSLFPQEGERVELADLSMAQRLLGTLGYKRLNLGFYPTGRCCVTIETEWMPGRILSLEVICDLMPRTTGASASRGSGGAGPPQGDVLQMVRVSFWQCRVHSGSLPVDPAAHAGGRP